MISFSAMENFAKKFGKRTIRERLPAADRKEGRSQSVRRGVVVAGESGTGGVWAKAAGQSQPYSGGRDPWVTTGASPRLSWRELNLLRKRRTHRNCSAHLTNSGASGLVKIAPWQVVKLSGHKGWV